MPAPGVQQLWKQAATVAQCTKAEAIANSGGSLWRWRCHAPLAVALSSTTTAARCPATPAPAAVPAIQDRPAERPAQAGEAQPADDGADGHGGGAHRWGPAAAATCALQWCVWTSALQQAAAPAGSTCRPPALLDLQLAERLPTAPPCVQRMWRCSQRSSSSSSNSSGRRRRERDERL